MIFTTDRSTGTSYDTASEIVVATAATTDIPTVSEWADEHRILSPESSPEPGRWRTDRTPYLRGIMDTLGDPTVRKVAWAAASQVGKTEVILNYLGRVIHLDPAPVMVIQPTLIKGKSWSRKRLAPMVRDTVPLRGRVAEARSRDASNTTLEKTFAGGALTIVGANSPAGLASDPIRDALFDEVDRYPASAGTEGDAIALGEQRTRNFYNRTIFYVSSPGDYLGSRIWPEYLAGDQRRFFVPCPECGEFQVLEWRQKRLTAEPELGMAPWRIGETGGIHWDTDEDGTHHPETAGYLCADCGVIIPEADRLWMLRSGEWIPTNPDGRFPSFHLSALYSPWVPWTDLVELWLDRKDTPERLQTFINLQLGEPWEERDQDIRPRDLEAMAERYPADVPHGVGVLVAAVDVQADRLEVIVRGYGAGEESWLILHQRIHGDPDEDAVWEELGHVIGKEWKHESGRTMRVRVAMIDSQYLKHRVARFVRGREGRGVYAAQGTDSRVRDTLKRAPRKTRDRIKPWTVDADHFKTILLRRIKGTLATAEHGGPGFLHFNHTPDAEYFAQLGAEIRKKERVGRRWRWVIKQVRTRNEAIDLEYLAIAALHTLGVPFIDRLGDLAAKMSEPAPDDDPADPTPPTRTPPPRGSSWATGWR